MNSNFENKFQDWVSEKKDAIELSSICSMLELDNKTDLVLLRKKIAGTNVSEIINQHMKASEMLGMDIKVEDTLAIAKEISTLQATPSRIDLVRLTNEWNTEKSNFSSTKEFVQTKLSNLIEESKEISPKDVVLFGFGRIGRLVARMIVEEPGNQLRLKAIVIRLKSPEEIEKRAYLLKKDSIHGEMKGTVQYDIKSSTLTVNGQSIKVITSSNPATNDYTQYGINDALMIDSTGIFRDDEALSQHLKAKGISKVLLTAPGKGNVPNIVYGVNHLEIDPDKNDLFSAASCTTNAVVPVLKVVDDNYGVKNGHIETVHAFTNDQNLVDNFHNKERRGRSAPMNMVITETGAAKASVKVLPHLEGKLTANSVRVPIPNVSLAILALRLDKETNLEEFNSLMKKNALQGNLIEQIDYSISKELVSNDVVGNTHALEYDSNATIVSEDKKGVTIYAWYDNEYGYTSQVIRLAKYISGVLRGTYY